MGIYISLLQKAQELAGWHGFHPKPSPLHSPCCVNFHHCYSMSIVILFGGKCIAYELKMSCRQAGDNANRMLFESLPSHDVTMQEKATSTAELDLDYFTERDIFSFPGFSSLWSDLNRRKIGFVLVSQFSAAFSTLHEWKWHSQCSCFASITMGRLINGWSIGLITCLIKLMSVAVWNIVLEGLNMEDWICV